MKRNWTRCITQVNKNFIAESECSKHYLVAENELCKNLPIKIVIITEKKTPRKKQDHGFDCEPGYSHSEIIRTLLEFCIFLCLFYSSATRHVLNVVVEHSCFKSRPGDKLSWLRYFVVFLSPSRKIIRCILNFSHSNFFPNNFQLTIHLSSHYSMLYIPRYLRHL